MNKRIIVSALAVTMGAGLVGSISGTVAWYQYSTRATVQMMGVSMGVARNLQVAVTAADVDTAPADDSAWKSELKTADLLAVLGGTDFEFEPITTSAAYVKNAGLDGLSFKSNPIKYKTATADWVNAKATAKVSYNLWVRAAEKDGDGVITQVAKEIGLIDAKISNIAPSGKEDISSAVRVAFETESNGNAIISKDAPSTNLYGPLDLDDIPGNDKAPYYSEAGETAGDDLVYGLPATVGTTYSLAASADTAALYAVEQAGTGANAGEYVLKGGIDLGATTASAAAKIKVTIWLEGWQKLGDPAAAVWDVEDYVGSKFFVGFQIGSGYAREA